MLKFSLEKEESKEVTEPWYDTFAGIYRSLETLEDFHKMKQARHEAGYDRDERLNQWILFDGAILFDSCGNASRGTKLPAAQGKLFRKDDFFNVVEALTDEQKGKWYGSYGNGPSLAYPFPNMVCAECGEAWTIYNLLDSCSKQGLLAYYKGDDIKEFIGKTIGDWRRQNTTPEKFAALRVQRYTEPYDPEESEVKNQYRAYDYLFDLDVVIEEGDQMFPNIFQFYHPKCLKRKVTIETQEEFAECMTKAGFKDMQFETIPNEYWSHPSSSDWFNVTTDFGTVVKIGWRKRVINVDYDKKYGCVTSDDVTKGAGGFHAWSYDKLTEYMTELYKRMSRRESKEVTG